MTDDHNRDETGTIIEDDLHQPNANQDENDGKMGEEENRVRVDNIIDTEDAEETQNQTHSHNLRPNRERDYSYRFTFLSVTEFSGRVLYVSFQVLS